MDAERIAAIRARLDAATAWPWRWGETDLQSGDETVIGSESGSAESYVYISESDSELVAHAPQDLADLLAEVERLRCLLAASLLGDLSRADRKTLVAHYAT